MDTAALPPHARGPAMPRCADVHLEVLAKGGLRLDSARQQSTLEVHRGPARKQASPAFSVRLEVDGEPVDTLPHAPQFQDDVARVLARLFDEAG